MKNKKLKSKAKSFLIQYASNRIFCPWDLDNCNENYKKKYAKELIKAIIDFSNIKIER
jgi:hypothetical protein